MSTSHQVILNKIAHLSPTSDCVYGDLKKSAANESTNPDLLKRFGEWAQNHPGTLGGLAAGAGALGVNAMTKDKDDSGPGLMGTLGTLGLLGGGGYMLDQLGGIQGMKNLWKAKDMGGSFSGGSFSGGEQGGEQGDVSFFDGLKNKFQIAKEVGNLDPKAVSDPMSYTANNLTNNPEAQAQFTKKNPQITKQISSKLSPYLSMLPNSRKSTMGPAYSGNEPTANPDAYGDVQVPTYTDPDTGSTSSRLGDAPTPLPPLELNIPSA